MKPKNKREPATLSLMFRYSVDVEQNLQLAAHAAFFKLNHGYGEEDDWHTLTQRINIGQTAAYMYFNNEVTAICSTALDVLLMMYNSGKRTNEWYVPLETKAILSQALNFTDEIQKACTRRELSVVMKRVYEVAAIYTK